MDNFEPWEPFGSLTSPPAPKVPRRDSLGTDPFDSNNPLFTGTAPAGGGALSNRGGRHKLHAVAVICTFCILTQITFGQQVPKLGPTWVQLRPNFAPTCHKLVPTWTHLAFPRLRPIWLQNGGHTRPNPKSSKRPFSLESATFFGIDDASR